ncbi:MAG: tRNA pseudouridine(55) synthase TruB [Armatimonadota bacterium]|nr:tRNA pseudouridine(55) synthase TruB [bacterium]
MDGIVNVHKTAGPTSHDIVYDVRRIFGQRRVGHAGTLDPMATGVLVVCLGKATRIVEYLMGAPKEYVAKMTLGQSTDSEDSTGTVTSESDASYVTFEALEDAARLFVGEIMQVPPMVSAVKHAGQRLYKLARQGRTVERAPRRVTIYALDILNFIPGTLAAVEMRVKCSSGTYIRTLCSDIGDKLGCGGHMSALTRTRVGDFTLDEAHTVEEVRGILEQGCIDKVVIEPRKALESMPFVEIAESDVERICHGMVVQASSGTEGDTVRIISSDRLIAIGTIATVDGRNVVKPHKVFEAFD